VRDSTLRVLNRCWLYLQVITLSAIVSADGWYILPEVKRGQQLLHPHSTPQWPIQGKPSNTDWNIWEQELSSLECRGVLQWPLGNWLTRSHQQWMTYYDTVDRMVYLQEGRDFRKFAQSNIQAEYSTRQSLQPRCNVETDGTTVSSLPNSAVDTVSSFKKYTYYYNR